MEENWGFVLPGYHPEHGWLSSVYRFGAVWMHSTQTQAGRLWAVGWLSAAPTSALLGSLLLWEIGRKCASLSLSLSLSLSRSLARLRHYHALLRTRGLMLR